MSSLETEWFASPSSMMAPGRQSRSFCFPFLVTSDSEFFDSGACKDGYINCCDGNGFVGLSGKISVHHLETD